MNIEKEKQAIRYLQSFEPHDEPYYLCYSGGKDSDVIRILASLAGVKHDIENDHTTVDAPETVRYISWCNLPYGRQIGKWVEKACKSPATVVMLLPARTDTKWFHDFCLRYGKIDFLRGRLKFGRATNSAPFPSMIVVFESKNTYEEVHNG